MQKTYSPYILFLILLFAVTLPYKAVAIDTLTVRQVYEPLSVGDTFDFSVCDAHFVQSCTYYIAGRRIISQKWYSPNHDTIVFTYVNNSGNFLKRDTIFNLDSIAIYQVIKPDSGTNLVYGSDTTTYFGYTSDNVQAHSYGVNIAYRVTERLGQTHYESSTYDFFGSQVLCGYCYSEDLIYYNNGTVRIGTPYYALSTQDLSTEPSFTLSPNPFSDNISITLNDADRGEDIITVNDVLGRIVYAENNSKGDRQHELALKFLPIGVYLFKVKWGDKYLVRRIVKE